MCAGAYANPETSGTFRSDGPPSTGCMPRCPPKLRTRVACVHSRSKSRRWRQPVLRCDRLLVGCRRLGAAFSSLKKERTGNVIYRLRDEARSDVFAYIKVFYNRRRRRRHRHLGGVAPMTLEAANSTQPQ